MLIVDSSTWVAILRQEPEARSLLEAIAGAASVHGSAASYVEVGAVVDGARDPIASRRFDELLAMFDVQIEPVTPGQALRAREAYRDFGRGSGHPAQLNYGDLFSYALATELRAPLLFKGSDFTHADAIDART
jgi:ribonuclease VapC